MSRDGRSPTDSEATERSLRSVFSEGPFANLDDESQAHFEQLRQSVGYNLSSILNDPSQLDASTQRKADWGTWFGTIVTDVFDFGASAPPPSTDGNEDSDETLPQLLSSHPIDVEQFQEYLAEIGPAHQAHTTSLGFMKHIVEPSSVPRRGVDASQREEMELFWDGGFDATKLLRSIPFADQSVDETSRDAEALEEVDRMCRDLQEKLLMVERSLFTQVQDRSDAFFDVSRSFEELHDEAQHALLDLNDAREDLRSSGDELVQEYMLIARLYRRREHTREMHALLCDAATRMQPVAFVEAWLSSSRCLTQAMTVASTVVSNLKEYNALSVPVAHYLRFIPERLAAQHRQLVQHVHSVAMQRLTVIVQRLLPSSDVDHHHHHQENDDAEWDDAALCIQASCALESLMPVVHGYQQLILDHIWLTTRRVIAQQYDERTRRGLDGLAATAAHTRDDRSAFLVPFRKFSSATFSSTLSVVLSAVVEAVEKAVSHWSLVRETIATSVATLHLSPANVDQKKFFSLMYDAAQRCVMDMASVREEENLLMRIGDSLQWLRTSFRFLDSLQEVLQQSRAVVHASIPREPLKPTPKAAAVAATGGTFRAVLVNHCRQLFKKEHLKIQEKIMQAITTEERWEQVTSIDPSFQMMATELCRCDEAAILRFHAASVERSQTATQADSDDIFDNVRDSLPTQKLYLLTSQVASGLADSAATEGDLSSSASRTLAFAVTHSLLLLLQALQEYDNLLSAFPFLAYEIIGKMYEALKLYDGQCAAMVLGASAVDLGILKVISVSHLCVASQCMDFLAELTKLMQARLLLLCPSDRLAPLVRMDFDRVGKEFFDHRNEFFVKIASLVKERIEMTDEFDPLNWGVSGNEWVMGMLRPCSTLLKQIRPILRDVTGVMTPLIAFCTVRLREAAQAIVRHPNVFAAVQAQLKSDIMLFKLNTEKFGFNALQCVGRATGTSTDEEFYDYFLHKQ